MVNGVPEVIADVLRVQSITDAVEIFIDREGTTVAETVTPVLPEALLPDRLIPLPISIVAACARLIIRAMTDMVPAIIANLLNAVFIM